MAGLDEMNVDLDDYEVPFKGIVEQSVAGIYILQDGRFRYVNETFARMCGLSREKLLGARLRDVANPSQRDALMARYERQIRGVGAAEQFVIRRTSSRNPGSFETHGTRVIFRGRPAIVGLGIDTTERERQRAELVEASERLQELVASANNVRENERHRVARELHDVIGGMLTAIKFDLSRLSRGIEALDRYRTPRARQDGAAAPALATLALTAAQTLQLTQETIETVRVISEGLRPGALDHLGLQDTLCLDLDRFERRYGIATRYSTTGAARSMDRNREIGIYRIFQEALTNVARHSKATEVTVSLDWAADRLALEISDNGLGFDLDRVAADGHLGLLGMQERARELDGTLVLDTGPRCGACLRLGVPVASAVLNEDTNY
ncbi:PAS domain-containing sensor histidine kinase [Cupriavidus lacunae]|uniref:histidine kinase n=1 Tax=Cupriavidus lacunae TaxID=2666307 RepID=A0A370NMK6_9BURK|nr:PAS domain-containing sensor histidine kinase [Cupriavidus lacunae]RDK06783.1 ATPase [Cupriavidus lacunae]